MGILPKMYVDFDAFDVRSFQFIIFEILNELTQTKKTIAKFLYTFLYIGQQLEYAPEQLKDSNQH